MVIAAVRMEDRNVPFVENTGRPKNQRRQTNTGNKTSRGAPANVQCTSNNSQHAERKEIDPSEQTRAAMFVEDEQNGKG